MTQMEAILILLAAILLASTVSDWLRSRP